MLKLLVCGQLLIKVEQQTLNIALMHCAITEGSNCGGFMIYPVYFHPKNNKPNPLNATVNSVNPVEGVLVLFPSYLDHSVNENKSNEERIVISFNINLT